MAPLTANSSSIHRYIAHQVTAQLLLYSSQIISVLNVRELPYIGRHAL
jgi:hypothetical protein